MITTVWMHMSVKHIWKSSWGAENLYNTVYYMEAPAAIDTDHVFLSQTNEEIWEENWQHIVQGTETMELTFWVILICSMFAICTCLVMSGEDNRRNLAYLRGIGAGKGMLLKMYLFQAIWNVACAILPVTWEGLSEGVENQGADEAFKAGDQLGLGWCCE